MKLLLPAHLARCPPHSPIRNSQGTPSAGRGTGLVTDMASEDKPASPSPLAKLESIRQSIPSISGLKQQSGAGAGGGGPDQVWQAAGPAQSSA